MIIQWPRLPRAPRTEAEAISAIRAHAAALGVPVDRLSDGELKSSVRRLGLAAADAGITAAQAMENLSRATRALR